MAARPRKSASRRRPPTPEQELAAIEARAAELRRLIKANQAKARRQFSPKAVREHRHRLGISATQYGKLLGASMQTVYGWEKARSTPRPDLLVRWLALTKLGDDEALRPLGLGGTQTFTPRQLRAERKRLGLSQEQYAALLGVGQATLSDWEAGKEDPRPRQPAEAAGDLGDQQGGGGQDPGGVEGCV